MEGKHGSGSEAQTSSIRQSLDTTTLASLQKQETKGSALDTIRDQDDTPEEHATIFPVASNVEEESEET